METMTAKEPTTPQEQRSSKRSKRRRGGRSRRKSAKDKQTQSNSPAPAVEQESSSGAVKQTPPPPPTPESPSASPPARTVAPEKPAAHTKGRVMIINVSQGEECRIAIVENGKLEEIYFERHSAELHVGNIYKGVVTNVEPGIQAAFVDFGIGRNGFLHISDVQPQYFPRKKSGHENVGQKISHRERPPIQDCFKRGDSVVVQVTKEGIGTKGPSLTTYLSLPGRYLVMMPGMSKLGVSRKIESPDDRTDMREVLNKISFPSNMGFILRTAGLGRNKRDLQRDLNYLNRLWRTVAEKIKADKPPSLLYQESDLVIRTIRDVYTTDFDRIVIDDAETVEKAREFLRIAMPRTTNPVELYAGREPLFHHYRLESEIERIYNKHVPLPSGGSLVIESTEALVAIDVNSGRYRGQDNAEQTAFKINMEAVEEIARQLRLRDLGGLIICDFIDMREDKHNRQVEKKLRDCLKGHKERAQILRISAFGVIEITRQRQRPSIKHSLFQDCTHCHGSGLVKSPESTALEIMRLVQLAIHHQHVVDLTITVAPDVGFYLLNRKKGELARLESLLGKKIIVKPDSARAPDQYDLTAQDKMGQAVKALG